MEIEFTLILEKLHNETTNESFCWCPKSSYLLAIRCSTNEFAAKLESLKMMPILYMKHNRRLLEMCDEYWEGNKVVEFHED